MRRRRKMKKVRMIKCRIADVNLLLGRRGGRA